MVEVSGIPFSEYWEIESLYTNRRFEKVSGRQALETSNGVRRMEYPNLHFGEIGFQRTENDLTLCIWTGCLWNRVRDCMREPLFSAGVIVSRSVATDEARLIILNEHNVIVYRAEPIPLVAGFSETLIEQGRVLWHKIRQRPDCDGCGKPMNIRQEKSHATFWECRGGRGFWHPPVWKDWDYGLPPEMQEHVKMIRKERRAAR